MDRLTRRTYFRHEFRSFIFVIFGFILVFICIQTTSFYFNTRLQKLISIQTRALELVGSWNDTENLNQELLITYNLYQSSEEWRHAVNLFAKDFNSFLESINNERNLANNEDLQIRVAKISMHWSVVRSSIQNADLKLTAFLASELFDDTGNLLVDFGKNLSSKHFNEQLLNVLEALRWTNLLSKNAFKSALIDLTEHTTKTVQQEAVRLRMISLLSSAFILIAAALFTFFRIAEMARSREFATRYADELSEKIMQRNLAERRLRTEKDKLHALINAIGAGIYVVSSEYIIEFQSEIIEGKYPGSVGLKCHEVYMGQDSPCIFCKMSDTLVAKEIKQVETMAEDEHWYEFIFTPFIDTDLQTKSIVLARDISERKKLETEATRAGYLSSIGELAAGVAHEINNPINGIISLTELIVDNTDEHHSMIRDAADRIIREGGRIAGIVQNLLSFARDRQEDPTLTEIEEVLSDALALIGKQIRKDGSKLFINLPATLPRVLVVKQELQQVFLNMLSNSRHALNSRYPTSDINKVLVIHGACVVINGRRMVRLTFQDSGIGIKKEDLSKIGLPFFTTKPPGEGTGLGVGISKDIIEKSGGNFYITSQPGKYTVATIELPAADEEKALPMTDTEDLEE